MNDGVKLTWLQIIPKQHKINHVIGGVIVDNAEWTAVVNGDHDVWRSYQIQHDLQIF